MANRVALGHSIREHFMELPQKGDEAAACWIAEAGDSLTRFVEQGYWEAAERGNELALARSMQPGERIVLKTTYRTMRNLPFDTNGKSVPAMDIQAVGTVAERTRDGKSVKVDLIHQVAGPRGPRTWYLYAPPESLSCIRPGEWMADALLAFVLDSQPQDIKRFRDAPCWKHRWGTEKDPGPFGWTRFYEAVADRLLAFQDDRSALIEGIQRVAEENLLLSISDSFVDGTTGPLRDICPFTVMALFNRQMNDPKKRLIAGKISNLLGVEVPVPASLKLIPKANNMNTWFFGYETTRQPGDISVLWSAFAAAAHYLESGAPAERSSLIAAFDKACSVRQSGWRKLSMGLHWAHPWDFPVLLNTVLDYMDATPGLPSADRKSFDGSSYLELADDLQMRFFADDCPARNFPELSLQSAPDRKRDKKEDSEPNEEPKPTQVRPEQQKETTTQRAYAVADILADGCFHEQAEIEEMLKCLDESKNLILQGPPGTGKTWLAKRLAYALMGEDAKDRVRVVQFHPNLSYEDFVRGWRPAGDGRLALADGVFMQAIGEALANPEQDYVVVIEEINRGNPAQIFGEMLTLLEASKRMPEEAIELCYANAEGERDKVYVPENLYVIGTMNTADRSLALIDLALRRRFAYASLHPKLNRRWLDFVVGQNGMDLELASDIQARISSINSQIADSPKLGANFAVGHSYVTPAPGQRFDGEAEARAWFRQVVQAKIGPLLQEYWFDAPDDAQKAINGLLSGWHG